MKRLLDYDYFTGISTYHEYDHKTKKTTIESVQDIDPYLTLNKQIEGNLNKKEHWWHIGVIPNVVLIQWQKECGHKIFSREFNEYSKKQQQQAEYRKLNPNKVRF